MHGTKALSHSGKPVWSPDLSFAMHGFFFQLWLEQQRHFLLFVPESASILEFNLDIFFNNFIFTISVQFVCILLLRSALNSDEIQLCFRSLYFAFIQLFSFFPLAFKLER